MRFVCFLWVFFFFFFVLFFFSMRKVGLYQGLCFTCVWRLSCLLRPDYVPDH
ncbi:unnamed protein product [Nyctereutes procyonoides]|uniref:(raccoon dog) hypothetical protein n=1 Tax=Nyctereutes procyonoides TaxID=34880 RepID=A0A811XZJ5_NYCPR|nr:unnamed protein product [Nyctereutes procyonoides]